jgi:hypothetical protein
MDGDLTSDLYRSEPAYHLAQCSVVLRRPEPHRPTFWLLRLVNLRFPRHQCRLHRILDWTANTCGECATHFEEFRSTILASDKTKSWSKLGALCFTEVGAPRAACEQARGADAFEWISAGVGTSPFPTLAVVQPDSGSNEVLTHGAGMDAEMDTDRSERLAGLVQLSCLLNIQRSQCRVATSCPGSMHVVEHR